MCGRGGMWGEFRGIGDGDGGDGDGDCWWGMVLDWMGIVGDGG